MYKVKNMIEKPKVKDAPSNLAIVGRYILLNDIYKFIKKTKIGSGGELQITDAIFLSSKINEVWGYKFSGKRYDCGSKIGFLKAQIATAFKDKNINRKPRMKEFTFKSDDSWRDEVNEFADIIIKNKKIKTGNSEQALKVMTMIDMIYKNDRKWTK